MNYMCRLCLTDEGIMEPIFTDQNKLVLEKIRELTSIQIKNVDGWPASICEDCKSKLTISVTFKKLCINTQNTILEQLGIPDETNEDTDHNDVICLDEEQIEKEDDIIEILDSSDDDESKHSNFSDEEMNNYYSESRKSSRIKKKSKKHYFEDCVDSSEEIVTTKPKKIRERRCSVKIVNYNEETDRTNNNIQSRLECKICHFICKTKLLLRDHRLMHSKLKQYQCNDCPASFQFSSQLKQHEICHTKKYTCLRCKKKFKYHKDLRAHQMTCS